MSRERIRPWALLRAMAWLRFRLTVNGLRGGARRDGMERFSRIAGLVGTALVALAVIPMAAFFGGLAAWGGYRTAGDPDAIGPVFEVFQAFLAFSLVAVLAGPVVRLSQGTQNLARLLLLPLPRRWFHLAEVASWLVDPFVLLVLPALALFPVGLLAGGRPGAAAVAVLAAALFLLTLATLGATLGFCMQWLFRDRRRGEALTVAAILAVGLVAFLPSYWTQAKRRPPGEPRVVRVTRTAGWPAWTQPLPNLLWTRAARGGVTGNARETAIGLGGLAAGAGILLAASGYACGRILDAPAGGGARGRGRAVGGLARIPGMGAEASAVAWTQARTWTRTVRGRINAFFPPLTVVLFSRLLDDSSGHWLVQAAGGPLLLLGAAFFSLLGLQPLMANAFATDRTGLALQFLGPIDDRRFVAGKSAGFALVYLASFALSGLVALALGSGGSGGFWIAAVCVALGAFLCVSPAAIAISASFPRTADLNKLNAAGNPNMLGATLLSIVTSTSFAVPLAAAGLAAWAWRHSLAAAAVAAAFLALAAIAHVPLLRMSSRLVGRRRENLALVAGGR
ncbi:MAG TPA: hypothetical protein VF139_17635 [Candidatus Polarisedimenticolaceae bacterium]